MRRLVRSRHFYIAAVLCSIFWVVATHTDNHIVLLMSNSLLLAGSAAVSVAYIPVFWKAVRLNKATSIQHLALGIAYAWTFSCIWRLWSLLWFTSGQEAWMVNNDIVAFLQAGIFLGACYHLTSPGAIAKDMPSLRFIVLGGVVGTAIFLTAVLALYSPDTSAIVQWMKPWVPR
jgi:hypothetical protein